MRRPNECQNPSCSAFKSQIAVIRWGSFLRADDCRRIRRFRCKMCKRTFSRATLSWEYRQKKRRINWTVRWYLSSKMSMRRAALTLGVVPRTIARKLDYHARIARDYFARLPDREIPYVNFDELQSSVHTKCKPVSIPFAVDARTRRVLGLRVVDMPAQHPLIEISLRRYGPRPDDRPQGIRETLLAIRPNVAPTVQIVTDRADRYLLPIAELYPSATHVRHKSRRARHGGQGELKVGWHDPLFTLNHTAAMVRDGIGRMVRKTWGNSKRRDRLEDHLLVWAHFHNEVYLPRQGS